MNNEIGFYRDRCAAVEKKRDHILEQVKELEEDKKEAESELRYGIIPP